MSINNINGGGQALLLRRRMMMGSKKHSRLPVEYQEVEWIFANIYNKPHITITFPEVGSTSFFGVRIKFQFTGNNGCCFQDTSDHNNFKRSKYVAKIDATVIGGNSTSGGMEYTYPETQVFQLDTRGKTINGVFTPLARNLGRNIKSIDFLGEGSHGYCYYIVILAGNLEYNCIPCYRKSDNKTGVYCLEQGVFFPNLGSIEFEVGPEV